MLTVLIVLIIQSCSIAPRHQLTTKVDLACRIIQGESAPLAGAEDFAYSSRFNGLFISSSFRRSLEKKGGLFWLDLSLPVSFQKAIQLNTLGVTLVDPHGVDILEKNGHTFLYIITHENRQEGIHYLHKFEILSKNKESIPTLQYIQAEQFPVNASPNDISMLSESFKVTSFDTISTMGDIVQQVDSLFGLNRSELMFQSSTGKHHKLLSAGFGNGVYAKKVDDTYTVWWSDTLYNKIHKIKFKYNASTEKLQIISNKKIMLESAPDNIMKGEDGKLYIASHYSFADFLDHKADANHPSPYVIYQIENDNPSIIYSSDGDQFSAASTAVKIGNTLYIGQIYNKGMKACQLKSIPKL